MPAEPGQPAAGKYHAKRLTVDGITFASQAEARRYQELRLLEQAGQVHELSAHPRFSLTVNGQHVCDYVADFAYVQNGSKVVEDVKSEATGKLPTYRLKKRLMKVILGIEISEVEA